VSDRLSKRRLRLWIRLLRVTRLTEAQLREFLRLEHQTTLPRFDVMAALQRAGESLTMSELSRLLLVSNSNTTVVVDRLENDGFVVRHQSPVDRRIYRVGLTDAGRHHFELLASKHEEQVNTLFSGVTEDELDVLDHLLQRLTPRRADDDNDG
jgi:DNA-binding MarR family transcriptional regulator